ncbi:MAG: NAD(P)-binding protein [Alphaproteobacteria bacterium]|nr:NAD(P)-binding protein [Alphaproteobacteria bacterium]
MKGKSYSDNALGMDRLIDRRDFLNGVSIGLTAAVAGPAMIAAAEGATSPRQDEEGYYPPALTGLRGSHTGSFETSHTIRDGRLIEGRQTGEEYDLVVVGGGISGLAAAWFFRQSAGPDAKILILDNHDDFGGHAKRNEFDLDGRTIIVNGGTLNLEQPTNYSTVARSLINELGIDLKAYHAKTDPMVRHFQHNGYEPSTFFDQKTFGVEGLYNKPDDVSWGEYIEKIPLGEQAKIDLIRLYNEDVRAEALENLSDSEKKKKLALISYNDYLTEFLGLNPDVLPFFQAKTHFRFYMGPEQVPALYLWQQGGYPGFDHLALRPTAMISPLHHIGGPHHGREDEHKERSIYFPDGNATITRSIVRQLIPGTIPGQTLDDLFTAPTNYAQLDRPENNTRIRLNAPVVNVAHLGDPATAKHVRVTYMRQDGPSTVKARNCILACWHMVIPYICRDFSAEQRGAMKYGIKAPRVYTNVLLRNGRAFEKLNTHNIHSPGEFHTTTSLHPPYQVGSYHAPIRLDEPVVVKMHRAPCKPGADRSTQLKAGRTELFNMSFETFERNIRDQLQRMLGAGGFDAARDIAAITVNRWPHGNAYLYNSLTEPYHWCFYSTDDRPCVIASQRLGRISIANSDAAANPFTDVAIDEAHRAVREVLADRYKLSQT